MGKFRILKSACFLSKTCGAFLAVVLAAANASVAPAFLYQRIEESLSNNQFFDNPFIETELRLQVTAPSGRPLGEAFTWYGFYDGDGAGGQNGNIWKFRLLVDQPGTWTVQAGFFQPGTNISNGPQVTYTYHVESTPVPGEHGHIHVDPGNWRRFRYADGTPWVPFPVMSSMLLGRNTAVGKQWIDEHIALGVDALMVRFHDEAFRIAGNPGWWHYLLKTGNRAASWSEIGTGDKQTTHARNLDYTRFDLASWHHNEEMLSYAHTKGVKLAIWFGVSGINEQYWSYGPKDYPNDSTVGPLQDVFIKYFLARWAAYTNWWHWTIDSEYEETGAGALTRIRTYAARMRELNPWPILLTTHVLGDWTPGNAPEFDIATLQHRVVNTDAGVTECADFVSSNDDYGLPVFNMEGIWNLANTTRSRIAIWTHIMAGGFAAVAHDGGPAGHIASSWGVTWDSVVERHKEDAAEFGKMSNFFNHTDGINIGSCQPASNITSVVGGNKVFCLSDPGNTYYVWLDEGGDASIDLSGIMGEYRVKRYRGTNLTAPVPLPDISGGAVRDLGTTPTTGFGNDYLFVVRRKESGV